MRWVYLLAVPLFFALWVWWKTASAANELRSPESVMMMLRALVNRGLDRAQLRFQVRLDRNQHFLFTKYFRNPAEVGIRSIFLETPSTKEQFRNLREALDERSIHYTIERDRKDRRGIVVDYGRDLELAQSVVQLVFERIMGIDLHTQGVAYFKYVVTVNAPHATGVDAPDEQQSVAPSDRTETSPRLR